MSSSSLLFTSCGNPTRKKRLKNNNVLIRFTSFVVRTRCRVSVALYFNQALTNFLNRGVLDLVCERQVVCMQVPELEFEVPPESQSGTLSTVCSTPFFAFASRFFMNFSSFPFTVFYLPLGRHILWTYIHLEAEIPVS